MLLECQNCGAPLDVSGNASSTRCAYCGKTSKVNRLKTVAQETPAGWTPPQSWVPNAESQLPPEPLRYRPARVITSLLSLIISFSVLGIGGLIAWRVTSAVDAATKPLQNIGQSPEVQNAITQAFGAVASQLNAASSAAAPGGVPLLCTGTQSLTLTAQNLTSPGGVPVVAAGNCELRLVRCFVKGTTGITASGNAHVTVVGGSITGDTVAVSLSGNAVLDASEAAVVLGDMAIVASGNAEATLHGATVEGRRFAVQTSGNANVDAAGAKLHGPVIGTRRVRR